MNKIFVAVSIFIVSFAMNANAALVDNEDGTVTQIRNDGSMLMWLKDANYAQTSGYDSDGLMTWYESQTWIDTLNSSNYLGYNDWRLPDTNPVNGIFHDNLRTYDGSSDWGFNISAPGSAYPGSTGSDLAYMFYTELGNLAYCDTSGFCPQPGNGLKNTSYFLNLQPAYYWSATSDPGSSASDYVFYFNFSSGLQDTRHKSYSHYAWAIRDVTVVPEPISSLLFVAGGTLFAGRNFLRSRLRS